METKIKWQESHTFKIEGKNFLVKVHGWEEGKRWNVYFFIYPGHRLFLMAREGDSNCPAPLPGVSYSKKHVDSKGKVSSFEWGNDYDWERYSDLDGEFKKGRAFMDAEAIFEFLSPEVTL